MALVPGKLAEADFAFNVRLSGIDKVNGQRVHVSICSPPLSISICSSPTFTLLFSLLSLYQSIYSLYLAIYFSILSILSIHLSIYPYQSIALPLSCFVSQVFSVAIETGIITPIAGTGMDGSGADGIGALASSLSAPMGLAIDSQGTYLYISDGSHRVRRVSLATGFIESIAGIVNSPGYNGDGGAATSAQLSSPAGLAVDAAGQVAVADLGNFRVRLVTPGALITTVVGTGGFAIVSGAGDGGLAANAQLRLAGGVAFDYVETGDLFICDHSDARVRRAMRMCPAGFTGIVCDANVNECASSPCASSATCVDVVNAFTCDCPVGVTGTLCDQDINEV